MMAGGPGDADRADEAAAEGAGVGQGEDGAASAARQGAGAEGAARARAGDDQLSAPDAGRA
jgi:hypothetical protein